MLIKEHTDWQFIISAKIGKFKLSNIKFNSFGSISKPKEPIPITDKKKSCLLSFKIQSNKVRKTHEMPGFHNFV